MFCIVECIWSRTHFPCGRCGNVRVFFKPKTDWNSLINSFSNSRLRSESTVSGGKMTENIRSTSARTTVDIYLYFGGTRMRNRVKLSITIVKTLFGGFIFYEISCDTLTWMKDGSMSNWELWRAVRCFAMLAFDTLTEGAINCWYFPILGHQYMSPM